MRSAPLRQQLKELEKELEGLQSQASELSQTHHELLIKFTLLRGWAEGLQLFQVCKAVEGDGASAYLSQPFIATEPFQELLQQESELLQQLADSDASGSGTTTSSSYPEALDLGIRTIAPAHDPIAYYRSLMQQPPRQQLSDMTAQQLAQEVKQSFWQLGIHLNKLQAQQTAAAAAEALQDIQDRHMHTLTSPIMLGKQNAVAQIVTFNLETLQAHPSHVAAATEVTLRLAPDLGLTEQQAHTIATGVELYLSLMQGNQREQRQLQAALAAIDSHTDAAAPPSSSTGLNSRAQHLEQQQLLTRRLQSLLQKEYVLQFVLCGWLVGSLSYEQMARASVLCWPYVIRLPHLGVGIQKWYRQREAAGKTGGSVVSSVAAKP